MSAYLYNIGLLFQDTAVKFPERTAIAIPGASVCTYDQLNQRANRIAHFLLSRNVQKNHVVAIFNNKSLNGYAAILACLKIGAIYTNVDFNSPRERVAKILNRARPVMLLDDHSESAALQVVSPEIIVNIGIEGFEQSLEQFPGSNPDQTGAVTGADPAYIMFTSGSTGFPKGAVMSHANVLNFVQWGQSTYEVTSDDVFTNVNQIYFDNSVFDIYVSLMSGATLVPIHSDAVKDPRDLVKAINESRCTIWFSVPSLLVYLLTTKALSGNDFGAMTRILFGGEGFPKSKLKQLYDLYGKRTELHNVYGPTECTCICSSYKISLRDFENMNELAPLGFLAPNFSYVLLNDDGQSGDSGELVLGGPNVGLGYYNDPERTSAAFISRNGTLFSERMYRTGDLVRRDESGHLHFKGRADNQVKHMGYRIELEEIEAGFSSIPYVNEVGVVYEKMGPSLGQIKAFVSISDPARTKDHLLQDIKTIVPAYMVPRVIVILTTLPKNQNGKVDRKQLALLKS